jgi:small subunit ribosomal protein S1
VGAGGAADAGDDHFDPALYGMPVEYDEAGHYVYPEGFDSETNEWLPGFEAQQAEWERQYAEARARYDAHRKQMAAAKAADAEAGVGADGEDASPTSYSSEAAGTESDGGTLASDEALAALREKLTGRS